jgi:hypothetical protein
MQIYLRRIQKNLAPVLDKIFFYSLLPKGKVIVINELSSAEIFVTCFMVLSQHLPGRTEENHEIPSSGWPICEPKIEQGTSGIRNGLEN